MMLDYDAFVKHPEEYVRAAQEQKKAGDLAYCSVIAISVVARVDRERAFNALAAAGRKKRRGATPEQMIAALKTLGIESRFLDKINTEESIINRFPCAHQDKNFITTYHPRRFPGCFNHLPKVMLLLQHKHVSAWRDGSVIDYAHHRPKRITGFIAVDAPAESMIDGSWHLKQLQEILARSKGLREQTN